MSGHGLGLGLSVVQGLVEAMGGDVRIEEAPGGGAAFRILFPRPEAFDAGGRAQDAVGSATPHRPSRPAPYPEGRDRAPSQRSSAPRAPTTTRRPHAGLVHAPGGSLAPRVPGLGVGTPTSSRRAGSPSEVVELTLQPLRRMPLDAAILFSDIMVPLHAIGVPIRIEAGRGPVMDAPIRDAAGLARLRPLEPETDEPLRARGDPAPREGARGAADRVRGSSVHARELSDRGRTEPHLRPNEGAALQGAGRVRPAPRGARRHRRARISARRWTPACRRCSSSTRGSACWTGTTTAAWCCRTRPGCSRRSPARTCRRSTSASAPAISST